MRVGARQRHCWCCSPSVLPHSSFETLNPGKTSLYRYCWHNAYFRGSDTLERCPYGGPCSEVLSAAASTGTLKSFFMQLPLVSDSALSSVGSCAAPWSHLVCAANPRHCWRSPTMCANMGAADHFRQRDVKQSASSLRATPHLRAMPSLMRAHSQWKSVRKVVFGLDWRILLGSETKVRVELSSFKGYTSHLHPTASCMLVACRHLWLD